VGDNATEIGHDAPGKVRAATARSMYLFAGSVRAGDRDWFRPSHRGSARAATVFPFRL